MSPPIEIPKSNPGVPELTCSETRVLNWHSSKSYRHAREAGSASASLRNVEAARGGPYRAEEVGVQRFPQHD